MASDDPIRASDADREVVVATLREAYTAGRLNLDEFDERTTAAYESKTWGDLRKLTADLPSQPILGGDVPGRLFRSGLSPDGRLVEFIELPREVHPFFVATQAHPEFLSRPTRPHPLFSGLIAAALARSRATESGARAVAS